MNSLESFLILRKATEQNKTAVFKDRALEGKVELTSEILQCLKTLEDESELPNLWHDNLQKPVSALPMSGLVNFEATAPVGYYEKLEDLISAYPYNPPRPYVIFKENKVHSHYYEQACDLASILADLSSNKNEDSCTIHAKNPLDIPFNYRLKNLADLEGIKSLKLKVLDDSESSPESQRMLDVYRSLFIQSVYDTLANVEKSKRFCHLLENFSDCMFRFNLSFRYFSDEANKAMERYEEKRVGLITSLNAVLGNLQTSLLGIPLAGLLAVKEIKIEEGLSTSNIIVGISVIIVGLLLLAMTFSQSMTLEAIRQQELQLRNEIDDSGGVKAKFGTQLNHLEKHHRYVGRIMLAVKILVTIFIAVTLAILNVCSNYMNF